MTAPTPAAVRLAMENIRRYRGTHEEQVLAAHIRAVAEEMRERADMHGELDEVGYYTSLRTFANRLEGRES